MSKSDEAAVDRGREMESASNSDMTASISHLLRQTVMGVKSHLLSKAVTNSRSSSGRSSKWPPEPHLITAMKMVLDSSTHHQNFPVPLDPSLVHFVTAEKDAYIPRTHITDVRTLWEGIYILTYTGIYSIM